MESKIDTEKSDTVVRKFPEEDIETKEQCREWLQILFEQRVHAFAKLQA